MKITKNNKIEHIISKSLSKSLIKQEILNFIDRDVYLNYYWTFPLNRENDIIRSMISSITRVYHLTSFISIYEKMFGMPQEGWDKPLSKESLEKHLHNLIGGRLYSIEKNPEKFKHVKEFIQKVTECYPKFSLKHLLLVYDKFAGTDTFGLSRMNEKINKIQELM